MGGSQSTISVTDESIPSQPPFELLSSEASAALQPFLNASLEDLSSSSNSSSGQQRMYKSYRVKQRSNSSNNTSTTPANTQTSANRNTTTTSTATSTSVVAVLKVAYLPPLTTHDEKAQRDARLQELAQELERIRNTTQDLKHVWPVQAWFGPTSTAMQPQLPTPVVWLRPHVYTTLHDRLINRPWLDEDGAGAEKLFLTLQLLTAVQSLHDAGLVHGALCTQNVGFTSTGWLVLLDVMPSVGTRPCVLPHDDPTEYWYCFSRHHSLAPERFVGGTSTSTTTISSLTPAMDVFSLGCCLVELHLPTTHTGEPCLDLGQLLDYRATQQMPPALQQKLHNLRNPRVRAACRHALSLDPSARLSPMEYWERIVDDDKDNASTQTPTTPVVLLNQLYKLLEEIQSMDTPDARLWHLVEARDEILYQTMGIPRVKQLEEKDTTNDTKKPDPERSESPSDLWTETEALLQELEAVTSSPTPDLTVSKASSSTSNNAKPQPQETTPIVEKRESRTALEQSCLLIYVQQVLSTLRHVQRPATKLKGLHLIATLSNHVSDDVRLQRIVPVLVSGLLSQGQHHKDHIDAVVRSTTLHTLTETLSQLTSFPPSDAQVLPQYIFKRITPLLTTDTNVTVRLALAQTMGRLAETAQRFLDISQAVRLAQAVTEGGLTSSGAQTPRLHRALSSTSGGDSTEPGSVFAEKVTQLLDASPPSSASFKNETDIAATTNLLNPTNNKPILVRSSYQAERTALADTLSKWVVHICTDVSDTASTVKRALLQHSLTGLCSFFSLDGVMGFLLPQLLTFLNDRHDWQLRAELFVGLPVVCRVIGRGATEEFVLPCVETALVDKEERVIAQALNCLAQLVEQGLLSRALVLPPPTTTTSSSSLQHYSLLDRYAAFLIHPSKGIRLSAVHAFCATCRALGSPDGIVYLTPVLRPFLRYQCTSWSQEAELRACLKKPWTRRRFVEELQQCHASSKQTQWTAVGAPVAAKKKQHEGDTRGKDEAKEDPTTERMQSYLHMLARRTQQVEGPPSGSLGPDSIEGSLKLAQSVVFPRRSVSKLPGWYRTLREEAEEQDAAVTEASSIRSVSALGSVYGLSIMGMEGAETMILGGATGAGGDASAAEEDMPKEEEEGTDAFWKSGQTKTMELALMGDWASEVSLDPEAVDTSLLVTKLRALKVPTLAPDLGGPRHTISTSSPSTIKPRTGGKEASSSLPSSSEWKPRMNSMIASSSKMGGHSAPVVRLAVSPDSSFFVSASHDGTCGVWEVPQLERSSGYLERSTMYTGHGPSRVNDVAMVEETYSVVSGASNGTVHVWRVDMVSSASSTVGGSGTTASPTKTATTSPPALERRERSRVVGTSSIRQVDPGEGEILAVSHFNSVSNSVVLYATQKGMVRTWDLRSPDEPFHLGHGPKLGHLSALALGGDRNWIITGTSRGFLALWDVRFQQPFKLWRHSRGEKIHRLAASYVPPPQTWGTTNANTPATGHRPIVFMGSPSNECALFDALSGSCVECFRTVPNDIHAIHASEEMPALIDVSGRSRLRNGVLSVIDEGFAIPRKTFSPSINCMVGSIGGHANNFLLTGGSDGCIRCWDFAVPSRSYIISGASAAQPRPNYERVDFDGSRRLMMCRQHSTNNTSSRPYYSHGNQGLRKPEFYHTDSIEDLKVLDNSSLISCSRDCTIKIWR